MGLDMYLDKYPRGYEPKAIGVVEEFVSWIKKGLDYSYEKELKPSFVDWCGYSAEDLPNATDLIKLLEMVHISYSEWDINKKSPRYLIHDNVGYWRKANAIHKWFVDNVQDGEDDCDFHRPVTKHDLETLFELCREVLQDHAKAEELLPVESGFFFGSQAYDEWYFQDIEDTANLCKELIDTFNFENYDLYYRSSW